MSDDDEPVIEPASGDGAFLRVHCPERDEPRSSKLCETTCADMNWSLPKAKEHREQCPVWQKLLEMDAI